MAVMISAVALAGCKKAEDEPGPAPVYYGVKVDLPKLDAEFAKAGPEIQANVALAKQALRYAQVQPALDALVKVSQDPALTENQKKVINELIGQVKQVIANSKPPAGQ